MRCCLSSQLRDGNANDLKAVRPSFEVTVLDV